MDKRFKHDEDIPKAAKGAVKTFVHREYLEKLLTEKNDIWIEFDDERAFVILELTPEAWRGLGHAFSTTPDEPEWRLAAGSPMEKNRPNTVWSEVRPLEAGPGFWLDSSSCMLGVRVVPAKEDGDE